MSMAKLQEIYEHWVDLPREQLERRGRSTPLLVGLQADGNEIQVWMEVQGEDIDVLRQVMEILLRERYDAIGIVVFNDIWYLTQPKGSDPTDIVLPPRLDPARREALIAVLATREGEMAAYLHPYQRVGDQVIWDGTPERSQSGSSNLVEGFLHGLSALRRFHPAQVLRAILRSQAMKIEPARPTGIPGGG